MSDVVRFSLSEGATVMVDPRVRHIPSEYAARVEDLWQQRDPQKMLFDAPIVSLIQHTPTALIGELVDFRMWYACTKDPELRFILNIHPLGVSGFTTWRDMVLAGKRSSLVSSYPGAMECCPSGNIDRSSIRNDGVVDLERAIIEELTEETGIQRASVRSTLCTDLYLSTDTGIFDVVVAIELYPEIDQPLLASHSKEYDDLFWVQRGQLPKCSWVPLSLLLLERG